MIPHSYTYNLFGGTRALAPIQRVNDMWLRTVHMSNSMHKEYGGHNVKK